MKVIVVEPQKKPVVQEMDAGLEAMQKIVGGSIEAVYPFEEPVALICNVQLFIMRIKVQHLLKSI